MIRRQVVAAMIGMALLTAGVRGAFTPAFAQLNRDVGDLTLDERFARIAEQVPEFGGLFVDEDEETLVVNVTQDTPEVLTAVRQAIGRVFPNEDLPRQLRLQEVPFAFSSLQRWKESATTVFGMAGVVALDIDEQANRLTIGVENEAFREALAPELDALGIPAEAWEVETMQAPTPQNSLQDRHFPFVGGLEIGFNRPDEGLFSCTAGFVARRSGVKGFVTNSHCTITQGGVENTHYTQPNDQIHFIGHETVDPLYFTGGVCPTQCGNPLGTCKCRYSDAAFVKDTQSGSFPVRLSESIAYPELNQGVAWDGTRLPVVAEGSPLMGLVVFKVGRTTGYTGGKVTATCVDSTVKDTRIVLKCQTRSLALSDSGDSGSPVFRTSSCPSGSTAPTCARLYGIHWGSARDKVTGEFLSEVFSPISNIQKSGELGALTNCSGSSPAC